MPFIRKILVPKIKSAQSGNRLPLRIVRSSRITEGDFSLHSLGNDMERNFAMANNANEQSNTKKITRDAERLPKTPLIVDAKTTRAMHIMLLHSARTDLFSYGRKVVHSLQAL